MNVCVYIYVYDFMHVKNVIPLVIGKGDPFVYGMTHSMEVTQIIYHVLIVCYDASSKVMIYYMLAI